MALFVRLFEKNPNAREIRKIVEILQRGGVIIYPTDTIYAIGCDIRQIRAVQRVAAFQEEEPKKAAFTMICKDLSNIATYARVNNQVFRLMKRVLPGPFTFILPATSNLPHILTCKRNTIGIRMPNNMIVKAIVEELGVPLLTTSVSLDPEEESEYLSDPELIYEKYKSLVDVVIHGGYGGQIPSTMLDCVGNRIEIVREGLGEL